MTAFVPLASVVLSAVQLWAMSAVMLDYFRKLAVLVATRRSDPGAYDPSVMRDLMASMMPMTLTSLLVSLLGWGLLALSVVAAYFDFQELGRLGYPRRFHWAWGFLGAVYPIGRAVVVHRQTGAGRATLWIALATIVASVLMTVIWSAWLIVAMFDAMGALRGASA